MRAGYIPLQVRVRRRAGLGPPLSWLRFERILGRAAGGGLKPTLQRVRSDDSPVWGPEFKSIGSVESNNPPANGSNYLLEPVLEALSERRVEGR